MLVSILHIKALLVAHRALVLLAFCYHTQVGCLYSCCVQRSIPTWDVTEQLLDWSSGPVIMVHAAAS